MILEFWGIIQLLYGNDYKNINFFSSGAELVQDPRIGAGTESRFV